MDSLASRDVLVRTRDSLGGFKIFTLTSPVYRSKDDRARHFVQSAGWSCYERFLTRVSLSVNHVGDTFIHRRGYMEDAGCLHPTGRPDGAPPRFQGWLPRCGRPTGSHPMSPDP